MEGVLMPITDKQFAEYSSQVFKELTSLNSRLESIEDKNDLLRAGIEERFNHTDLKIEKLNHLLTGNGTPERGLIVRMDRIEQANIDDLNIRVDRMEQKDAARTWIMRTSIVSSLGCIGAIIAAYFRGKF